MNKKNTCIWADRDREPFVFYDRQNLYVGHGMSCIEKSLNKIRILLFGGEKDQFDSSLTEICINFNFSNAQKIKNFRAQNFVTHKFIERKESTKERHSLHYGRYNLHRFGCDSIVNSKQERIIVIIGGDDFDKSILLLNTVNHEVEQLKDVLPFKCDKLAASICHGDHIHVVTSHDHFLINLDYLHAIMDTI